jgi:hypothetical protein
VARAAHAPRTVPSLLALAAAALMLMLSGCSAVNPITTGKQYSASDGVRLELGGQVGAANLMVVSPSRTGPGVLLGALTNRTDAATTVTITNKVVIDGLASPAASEEFTAEVPLAAGQTVLLGTAGGFPTSIPISHAPVGGLLGLELSTPESGRQSVSVPVLDGTLPEYSTISPRPTPSPSPTPSATPSPSAS